MRTGGKVNPDWAQGSLGSQARVHGNGQRIPWTMGSGRELGVIFLFGSREKIQMNKKQIIHREMKLRDGGKIARWNRGKKITIKANWNWNMEDQLSNQDISSREKKYSFWYSPQNLRCQNNKLGDRNIGFTLSMIWFGELKKFKILIIKFWERKMLRLYNENEI